MKKWRLIDYLSLFLFSFVVTVSVMTFLYPPSNRLDFSIYLLATKLATLNKSLYPFLIGNLPFTYPPSIFPFFLPFLFIRSDVATSIWNGMSLACLIVSVWWILHWVSTTLERAFILLLFSAILLLEPVRETLLFGQNNIVVLFFTLLSFLFSRKEKNIFSGISLGVAASLKVFPIFLVVYFFAKKQWVNAFVGIGTFLLFLIIGTFGHIHYIEEYVHFARLVVMPVHGVVEDQSFSSFFLLLVPHFQEIQLFMTVSVYLFFVTISFYLWKKMPSGIRSDFLFFSEILAYSVLIITPLAWVHHLVFLIPVSLGLLLLAIHMKKKTGMLLGGIILVLFFINTDDMKLFLQGVGIAFPPLLSFHALVGLWLALLGRFSVFSKTAEQAS